MAKKTNRSYYNKTNICDNIKNGSRCEENLFPHNANREYDNKGNWTGRWLCNKCWGRYYQRNNPVSSNNLIKSMTNCRIKGYNRDFYELTYRELGRIGEDIVSLMLGLYNQNDLADNYNSLFDIEDHKKYGRIQVKIATLNINRINWQFDIEKQREFDTLVLLCMDENQPWKIVERVYIIPVKCEELFVITKIVIYKNTMRRISKWEKFKVDSVPYDSIYQKIRIRF